MADQASKKEEGEQTEEWIAGIQLTLGCVELEKAKTGSICRVPGEIRGGEDKEYRYTPQLVAMGPFHRGTRSDLQIMERTKWQYMHDLLARIDHQSNATSVKICSEALKTIEPIIRASYGEKIDMGAEELSRIMLLDGCFLLELLLKLKEKKTDDPSMDNKEKLLRLLADLTLLENQIPFVVLTTLSSKLSVQEAVQQLATPHALSRQGTDEVKQFCWEEIVKSLLTCNFATVADKVKQNFQEEIAASLLKYNNDRAAGSSKKGVYHFLHLIHLCSLDPYGKEEPSEDPPKLQRCARKLQAFGITITASQTNDSQGNDDPRTVASVLRKFVDKLEFKIEFNESEQELIIPTLHIKEATEVKWRNLIAWEQIGLSGIGYKFTSYAYFFKGLVRSVHDIKLLKDRGVIVPKAAKDEDLLIMFQSIITGEERTDSRYGELCARLNEQTVKGVAGRCALMFRMPWHYWRRFLEWLRHGLKVWLPDFVRYYSENPWKIVGVVSGTILLILTAMLVVYAARGQ
ncbi:uncharacterized protein LOC114722493 [Neltuma alba]|uniref:uncharacterized protein LOC114722493 n=1 Tax=Neltuma alba TaxID=207710 RepID=UPI0010A3809B|nr:uncharacterized protein LOC114722493 [Prosopis alba]